MYQNKFSGPIPETLGELHALEELALHDNMLSGQVPSAALAKLVRLKDLQLGASLHGGYSATVPEKWQRYMRERGGNRECRAAEWPPVCVSNRRVRDARRAEG